MVESALVYLPVGIAFLASLLFLWLMNWLLLARHESLGTQSRLPRQLVMFALTVASLLLLIVLFPMAETTRGQIITLLGLVITGVIALSSTSFVANVMAGLMLQVVKSFHPGDFIKVGQYTGRVTERGLFHTEIQTEDRDLTTIPNLHLATNPVTVVRSTGTIISAELSLGYDIPRTLVEDLLKQAALSAELQEPFVLVIALNDFSVLYRISGFLSEVKNLITAKSTLKKFVLDILHENEVEIVSPAFMNQRQLSENRKMIPQAVAAGTAEPEAEAGVPEELIFDKAEEAAETELMRAELERLNQHIEMLQKQKKTLGKSERQDLEIEIKVAEEQKQRLIVQLEQQAASSVQSK